MDPLTGRHRRGAARTEPARAPGAIGITDSHIERLMTDEAAAADHRHAGRYLAVRGLQVLAASLNAPERRRHLTRAGGAQ